MMIETLTGDPFSYTDFIASLKRAGFDLGRLHIEGGQTYVPLARFRRAIDRRPNAFSLYED